MNTRDFHETLTVVDGLIFYSDGSAADLRAGNLTACNLTVTGFDVDFTQALDDIAIWLERLADPACEWMLIRSVDDIGRARESGRTGLIMGWQNMRPIDDKLQRIRLAHALGVRVMQLTYNYANRVGDGCLEARNAGLTGFGHEAITLMNDLGVAIDLSHCGERTCLDAARLSRRPVLLTHANAKAVSDRPRNKSDEVLRAVANTGGIIGLSIHGFMNWSGNPSEPPSLDHLMRHVKQVANLVGYEHLGIGTDFASVRDAEAVAGILQASATRYSGSSGEFTRAFGNALEKRYPAEMNSPRLYGRLTDALLKQGIPTSAVEGIMGRNLVRAFGEIWS